MKDHKNLSEWGKATAAKRYADGGEVEYDHLPMRPMTPSSGIWATHYGPLERKKTPSKEVDDVLERQKQSDSKSWSGK